jgi:hypothetical protein
MVMLQYTAKSKGQRAKGKGSKLISGHELFDWLSGEFLFGKLLPIQFYSLLFALCPFTFAD